MPYKPFPRRANADDLEDIFLASNPSIKTDTLPPEFYLDTPNAGLALAPMAKKTQPKKKTLYDALRPK